MASSGSFGVLSNLTGKVDQGIDFGGTGAIPALGPAVVTDITYSHIKQDQPGQGPWPVVVYKLLGGPHRGQYVYVAENFTPQVKVGDHLRQGQSIGHANGSFPYIEVGFNQGPTGWRAYGSPDSPQPQGYAMRSFVASQIGHTKVTGAHTVSGGSAGAKNPDGTYGKHHRTADEVKLILQGLLDGRITKAQAAKQIGVPASAITSAPLDGIPFGGSLQAAADTFLHPFKDLAAFFSWLVSPRGLETIGGGILMLMGIYLLVRQVGLAADVPIPSPIQVAAKAIPGAGAAPKRSAPSRSPVGPSERPATRRQQVVHHYHPAGSPASERNDRASRARPISDPATNEIPF